MSYFNISLDNDITYLLTEIGKKVKVNNIPAKAIINNTTQERNFDDKRIITHEELKRGVYIEYNDLWFLVLNEINDKRYNTYYKGIMRRCNEDIKFIIGDKLYLFYSVVQGDKFYISEGNIVNISADTITVTMPETEITKLIAREDGFIKWGQKWKVEGIDRTKDGLVILNSKVEPYNSAIDDIENEIANRYKDSQDRLNGNITPIMPFDEPEIPEEPTEPEEPDNPDNPLQGITYSYTAIMESEDDPDDRLWFKDEATYIIHKFIDGEEVNAEFEFTLEQERENLAQIESYTNNSATITTNFGRVGWIKLIAIDTETSEVAIEKLINVLN